MRVIVANPPGTCVVILKQEGDEVVVRTESGWSLLTLRPCGGRVEMILHTGLPTSEFVVDDEGRLLCDIE